MSTSEYTVAGDNNQYVVLEHGVCGQIVDLGSEVSVPEILKAMYAHHQTAHPGALLVGLAGDHPVVGLR